MMIGALQQLLQARYSLVEPVFLQLPRLPLLGESVVQLSNSIGLLFNDGLQVLLAPTKTQRTATTHAGGRR